MGDEEFQRKCSEKFAELKESGKTIVIVSHALGTMRNLCDQVALLEHGALVDGRSRRRGRSTTYLGDVHVDRVADGEHGVALGLG